ncbi:glycosyltransferase family 2 protein [Mucilaginibacter sp. UYCu711]|uniref:glycosyltransferase family 2 protein n=1 Tax=Mucilaginibacter sp. UYCu711 TaxID=3156339 RepID=UPI003D20BFD1
MNNTQLPLVSILIPIYNQKPHFLREAITSAINQTYPNIEIVLSDNLSTDNTVQQVIAEFEKVKHVVSCQPKQHLSMIDNFCFAAENATGEYLSFLSSDDMLEPECIEQLMGLINRYPDITFAFGNIDCIDAFTEQHLVYQRDETYRTGYYTTQEFLNSFIYLKDVWMNGDIIRKDKYFEIDGIGYKPIRYAYDMAFALRLLAAGAVVGYVGQVLGKVRIWTGDKAAQKIVQLDLLTEIHDIIENYIIVLKNQYLLDLMDGGKDKVLEIRNNKVRDKVKYAVICYVKGYIDENAMLEIKDMVNNLNDFTANLYLVCCKSPFKQLLQGVIGFKNIFSKRSTV